MPPYAGALAFRGLLALFPFVIFLVALLGFLRVPGFFDWLLSQSKAVLPEQAAWQIEQVIWEIRDQARGGLLSLSIILAIWSSSAGVRSLITALNAAYDVEEARPAWKRLPLSIAYTLALAVMVIAANRADVDGAAGDRVARASSGPGRSIHRRVGLDPLAPRSLPARDRGGDRLLRRPERRPAVPDSRGWTSLKGLIGGKRSK